MRDRQRVNSTRFGNFNAWEAEEIYPDIRRGVDSGESNKAIARKLGISEQTVYRFRKRHGLPNFYGKETK